MGGVGITVRTFFDLPFALAGGGDSSLSGLESLLSSLKLFRLEELVAAGVEVGRFEGRGTGRDGWFESTNLSGSLARRGWEDWECLAKDLGCRWARGAVAAGGLEGMAGGGTGTAGGGTGTPSVGAAGLTPNHFSYNLVNLMGQSLLSKETLSTNLM